MKKRVLLVVVAVMAIWHNSFAYDFSTLAPSGQTLYFNIVNNEAVLVTPSVGSSYITGTLTIPSTVFHNGTQYIVTTISSQALSYCNDLTSVTIPNTVTTIGDYAFSWCTSLYSLFIPASVSNIGNQILSNCHNLTSIIVDPGNTNYDSRDNCKAIILTNNDSLIQGCNTTIIPNTVISIGDGSFHGFTGLMSIEIPNSVINIGTWAFLGCSNLSSVTIGNNVTTIGSQAFSACSSLISVTIPSSVNIIGSYAFSMCNLTSIKMRGNPPQIDNTVFSSCPNYIPIYVPCGTLSSYQNSPIWSSFTNFVNACVTITTSVNDYTRGGVTGGGNYTIGDSVTLTAIPFVGSHFIGWSTGSQENPLSFIASQNQTIVAAFGDGPLPHDTIYLHDTLYIDNYIHDTTIQYVNQYIHDTTFYAVYIHDTITMHDTSYVSVETLVHDTTYITVHDTVIAYVNVPVHDTVFAYIEVPVHDTIWLHDTITIHDTIYITQESIDGAEMLNAKVYSSNGQIVVEGAMGNTVTMYDVNGRMLATRQDNNTPMRFDAPVSGTYMIKIGNYPARKVVVIR